jgi:hypothetical protein
MIDPEEKEFAIAVGILDDCRRYIAAHKIQRWDVVKWGVSVNLALAVAAAAPALADFRPYLLLLSAGVAAASWGLVLHNNRRMTRIRDQAVTVVNWLRLKGVDYDAITGQSTQDDYSVGETYDLQEFYMFLAILVASPALVFFSLFLHHPSP